MMTDPEKILYLIDGTAYIHRAFHAIRSLKNSKGMPTNAVFGFTRMLIKLMADHQPVYAAMFFDSKGPTFRHEIYPDYKANRPPMPEDMAVQLPYINAVTHGFSLPVIQMQGFEADDLIGTYARVAEKHGYHVVMVTGDKDFIQLITENAVIWDPMKDQTLDRDSVEKDMGITPGQMADMLGLAGDASDNIPGVPGIGPKTAVSLLQKFGSLEDLYAHLDDITSAAQRKKLAANRDRAFLSRDLARIRIDAPIDVDIASFRLSPPDNAKLAGLFKELEFRQLQKEYPAASGSTAEKHYHVVCDADALANLVQTLLKAERIAVDTETTGIDPMSADLVGISAAVDADEAFYVPCGHHYPGVPVQLPREEILSALRPVLENPDIAKIGQNIKYDWAMLNRYGIDLAGVNFDTMIASYLLSPEKRAHSLDQIALDYLDHRMVSYEEVTVDEKDRKIRDFSEVCLEKAVPYACADADMTLAAYHTLKPELESAGLMPLFETVEMPLVPVLLKMEKTGIRVDPDRLAELSKDLTIKLDQLERAIYETAGETFNINSPQQLGMVLFDKLKLPVQKKTKKKTGYSTDVDVLNILAGYHELPALILEQRSLVKLKSTYVDALFSMIHPQTGRVHTSFNQTITATGRLSSSHPNLQNIPIRTEAGRNIRRAFIPREGWVFVSMDYSQVELRLLAHYAGDENLIQAFTADEDIHMRTAADVFQAIPAMITPDLRRQAKMINFGIIYGMGAYSLSKELGISQKMAKTYIDNYFKRYKGVRRFIDDTIEQARQTGRVSTELGRIRFLPEINSSDMHQRNFAERTAVNTRIQGTAADLIKLAMIRVDAAFTEKNLSSAMLLSVHDELVFEVPPEELETVKTLAKTIMETVWTFSVPLKVNVSEGRDWAEAH